MTQHCAWREQRHRRRSSIMHQATLSNSASAQQRNCPRRFLAQSVEGCFSPEVLLSSIFGDIPTSYHQVPAPGSQHNRLGQAPHLYVPKPEVATGEANISHPVSPSRLWQRISNPFTPVDVSSEPRPIMIVIFPGEGSASIRSCSTS